MLVTPRVPVIVALLLTVNAVPAPVSVKLPAIKPASVPVTTSDVFVTPVKNTYLDCDVSYPKNPSLAAVSKYLNSTPRSLLSFDTGAVSPLRVIIGSSTVNVVALIVPVAPLRVVLPVTVKLPPTNKFWFAARVTGALKVDVALTVNVSADASPKVELPLAINAPVRVVEPVTPNVPATVVLPDAATTINLLVLTLKSPVTSNVPAIDVLPDDAITLNLFVLILTSLNKLVMPVTESALSTPTLPLTVKVPAVLLS